MTVQELREWLDCQELLWDDQQSNFYTPFEQMPILIAGEFIDTPLPALENGKIYL